MDELNEAIYQKILKPDQLPDNAYDKEDFVTGSVGPSKQRYGLPSAIESNVLVPGLRFRVPVPTDYHLVLSNGDFHAAHKSNNAISCTLNNQQVVTLHQGIVVADAEHEFVEGVNRTPLIQKQIILEINDGMLQKVTINKPSSVVKAVSLPLDILTAIVSPAASLFHTVLPIPTAPSGTSSSSNSK